MVSLNDMIQVGHANSPHLVVELLHLFKALLLQLSEYLNLVFLRVSTYHKGVLLCFSATHPHF